MRTQVWVRGQIATVMLVCAGSIVLSSPCIAQVVPDQTLPVGERSQVSGTSDTQIDGGAIRGSNLFHSFQQFSIPTGGSASFNNAPNITNIITRVTGNNLSNIDGLIRANGTANLFLINPNGIAFGANARLELGGSFFASTAEGLTFANGFEFSATSPQTPPLLTISAPIGLQYGSGSGEVRSQGAILRVPNGQTLNLTGGNVAIEGGQLLAPGGRVELAGVAAAGEVGLTQQGQEWRLSVPDGLARADIAIGNDAIVDVRSGGGGSIAITARNVTITGLRTRVGAGIAAGLGTVDAQAGDIGINATEAVNLDDDMVIGNQVSLASTGNAGNISITTGRLSITNGAQVGAATFGRGNAGNVTITARDAVYFDGVGSDRSSSGVFSQVISRGIGQGGNVSITTGRLSLTNGAVVSSAVSGQGNAGNVTITARDAVSFDGVGSNGSRSGAASAMATGGIGQGGNVSITTGTLSITNGAQVVASMFGQGRGGNVNITTGRLSLTNGAQVSAAVSGQGNAGNVTITVSDAVSFDGVGSNGFSSGAFSSVASGGIGQGGNISITTGTLSLTKGAVVSSATSGRGNAGNVTITARDAVSFDGVGSNGNSSGVFSSVATRVIGQGGNVSITTGRLSLTNGGLVNASTSGQGNAGNVTITARDAVSFDGVGSNGNSSGAFSSVRPGGIGQGRTIAVNTDRFSITNRAQLSASSQGQGAAGNLEVVARQLRLDNQGSIQAQTTSGQGGNITLQVPDLLLLRRGSFISTTAGTDQAGGDGGNITFNGNFIVAVPQEDSNITANAFLGRGGNVRITTQGLFGIEPRAAETALSDITASSQFGISGTITLNTPDVDPSRGLVQLPTELQDTSGLIAATCPADEGNSFAITGRGGLPEDPRQPLMGNAVWSDDRATGHSQSTKPDPKTIPMIVEAQGWIRDRDGRMILIADRPDAIPQTSLPLNCLLPFAGEQRSE